MAQEKIGLTLDIRGLDMVTPVDLLSDGRTPWSKNFRLYAQQSDDRQVAISSRKGPGFYMSPLSETKTESLELETTKEVEVGVTAPILAQRLVTTTGGRLNRLDFKVKSTETSNGPLMVSLYSNKDGRPSDLLAQSSIGSGSITDSLSWATVRFVDAPLLANGDELWVIFEIQDDGDGTYLVGCVEDEVGAKWSDTSFAALDTQPYGVNYKMYQTPDIRLKGTHRFNREAGDNITVAAFNDGLYALDPISNSWTVIESGHNASATHYSFAVADGKLFWVNSFDDLKAWDGDTVETITDPELPILSHIIFHKDRLFGVVASDKNKFIWSEAPGNPTQLTPDKQWYYAYLSTNFAYVPAPKTGSPVTGLVSFQDALFIFTQDNKWVFSGYDKGSFSMRQSTGAKGALGFKSVTQDENHIYFVSDDGLYQFNGSQDTNISKDRIQPLFDACGNKFNIVPVVWKNKVRFYMQSKGSPHNDIVALYNKNINGEWELDTDTWVDRALYFDDADDDQELLEFSSLYAMPMLAEQGYNSLGAPIDFEYRMKYDSFGLPAQKKRVRRYFPILQGVDNTFNIRIMMDKDFQDNPRIKDVLLAVNGSTWGDFKWGDGTTWGGDKSFKHHRQSYPGSAYYWQLRIARKGVNNRVAFIGAQYKYRIKRM